MQEVDGEATGKELSKLKTAPLSTKSPCKAHLVCLSHAVTCSSSSSHSLCSRPWPARQSGSLGPPSNCQDLHRVTVQHRHSNSGTHAAAFSCGSCQVGTDSRPGPHHASWPAGEQHSGDCRSLHWRDVLEVCACNTCMAGSQAAASPTKGLRLSVVAVLCGISSSRTTRHEELSVAHRPKLGAVSTHVWSHSPSHTPQSHRQDARESAVTVGTLAATALEVYLSNLLR